jgi:hypothetical protein
MAVPCAACGVSMTVAEVTTRPYDGVVGNYHRDCAYMEYLVNSGPALQNTSWVAEVSLSKDKLNKKHITQAVPTPVAPAGSLAAGTNLGIGAYNYAVSFQSKEGQTVPGTSFPITTTTGNQKVNLTGIPTGPGSTSTTPLTTSRVLYRTTVGGGQLKVLTVLNNNTATTFSDAIADGSLGANAPTVGNFCGADFP